MPDCMVDVVRRVCVVRPDRVAVKLLRLFPCTLDIIVRCVCVLRPDRVAVRLLPRIIDEVVDAQRRTHAHAVRPQRALTHWRWRRR